MVLSLQGWRFSRIWSIYRALQMFFWYLFFVVMLEGFLVFCQRKEKVCSTEILGWAAAGEEGTGSKSCSEFSSSSPSLPPGTFLRCKIPVRQEGIICRSCCCPVRRTWCSWPSVEKGRAIIHHERLFQHLTSKLFQLPSKQLPVQPVQLPLPEFTCAWDNDALQIPLTLAQDFQEKFLHGKGG